VANDFGAQVLSERMTHLHGLTADRFDRLDLRLERMDLRLERVEDRLERMELRLGRVEEKIDSLGANMTRVLAILERQ
jgi:hypothetical protein